MPPHADRCRALADKADEVKKRTGLVLDPYFSGTKVQWLLDNVDGARKRADAGELVMGNIDTFLVWRLTGGSVHVTDVSNASRTMLFDLNEGKWSPWLLDTLGVPASVLPEVRSSSEVYGETQGVKGLPDGIPIAGIAGDQQAALFGQACFDVGDLKCTYGTGAFILVNTGTEVKQSNAGLLSTVAWKLADEPMEYAIEGSVFCAGAAVQWLRDAMQIIEDAPSVETLARQVEDSGDAVFVPALTGLGAPHWRADARGLICGITRDTSRAHLARATLEGIALQCHEVFEAMKQDTGKLGDIKVDGGACANNLLMQIQADLAGTTVVRPEVIETTAAGAAFLAGLATDVFENKEAIKKVWREDQRFTPKDTGTAKRLLEKWHAAVQKA